MAIVLVVDEAANAIRRKPPTDQRLVRILNGYHDNTMPTSEEARWLAAFALGARGHIFNKAPKEEKKKHGTKATV